MSEERSIPSDDDLHYVQVRYPRGDRWITVACEPVRRIAARQAALAFPDVVNADGQHAMQVRVIARARLGADEGRTALQRAEEDLLQPHRNDHGVRGVPERGRQDSNLRPSA